MRRGRILLLLALVVILGLVAVFFIWQRFLQPPPATTPAAGDSEAQTAQPLTTVNVVVVTQRVARGDILDEAVLGVIPIQQDLLLGGMFTNISDAAGRQAKFDLEPGMPLTDSMLVAPDEQLQDGGSVAAMSIPPGMVAVSIPIDRWSSVAYGAQAGDHVNVIVTLQFIDLDTDFQTRLPNNTGVVIAPGPRGGEGAELVYLTEDVTDGIQGRAEVDPVLGQTVYVYPAEEQRQRRVTQTLIQDAVILRMGDFQLPTAGQPTPEATAEGVAAGQADGEAAPPPAPPSVVTLVVTPQDAVTLNHLVYSGARLTMALRSAGDASRIETEAVTLQFLLDQYNIRVPVKLPYGITETPPVLPELLP